MRASVCYVNPTLLLRRPISELAVREAKRRDVAILTPRAYGKGRDTSLHHSAALPGVTVISYPSFRLPCSRFEWPIPGPSYLLQCWRILKRYDVIHLWAHFYLNNLLLILLSLLFPKKKVILTMDTLPGYSFDAGPVMNALFRAYTWTLARIVFWRPQAITLYGAALLPHAAKSGIRRDKVQVIPTGIEETADAKDRARARASVEREFRLARRTRIVLYAGLLNPRKRVGTVLDVARRLHERTIYLIAGDGPERAALERRARAEGLPVLFLGWRQDMARLYAASDCLLFPSSAEGLPGVVMEAMAAGTPVLTTRIPCTTDLVVDEEDGLLCAVGDTACFTKKLEALLASEGRRARLAAAAKKKVGRAYSWRRILPQYERLYEVR